MKLKLFLISLIAFINCFANEDLEKVSLQLLWKHQFEFAGFYIAKEKGYYKDAGLDVTFKEFQFGTNIVADVEKGKSTFGIGYPNIILDKANGSDIRLLNALFQSSPHVFITLQSSNINSIKDFKNKKIMIENDAVKTAPLLSLLYSNNINLEDFTKTPPSFNIDDLINQKVDVYSAFLSNEVYKLQKENIKYKIWDPKDYGFDFYNDFLFTSTQEIENNPLRVKKFRDATLKGWEYAFENIEETVQLILKKYNTQNKTKEAYLYEAKVLKELAYLNTNELGDINKIKIQRIIDIYNLMGLINSPIKIEELIYKPTKKDSIEVDFTQREIEYLQQKNITMCIDPDWMPFEKFENDKHIGISADYFKIFEEKLQKKIRVIHTKTWSESLEYARQRKCDLLSLAMETPVRKEYMNFTAPYLSVPLVIATNTDVTFINDVKALKGKKIGIPKGYAFVEIFKKKYPFLDIVEVPSLKEGLREVKDRKIFGYIGTLASVGYMFQTQFTGELKIAGKFDEVWELGIGVRNDDHILLDIMQKLIDSLDANTKQSILNNWLAIKYEQKVDYEFLWQILSIAMFILFLFFYRQYILSKSNQKLKKLVDEKTKELTLLNKDLEQKVENSISEIRRKDQILYEQSKLAAMGEMIGNISHQWRQPLSIISTASSGIKMKLQMGVFKEEDDVKSLDRITEASLYLSQTIDDFRNFLNPKQEKKIFNIQSVIDKTISMFGSSFKTNNIEFVKETVDCDILGSENELLQVLINIFNNSKDAFKEKNHDQHRYIFITINLFDDRVILSIKDTAGGIDPKIISNIFEPYFTTKHQSIGTGIGLYMSHQIITNKFDGNITATTKTFEYQGETFTGAEFEIVLPLGKN